MDNRGYLNVEKHRVLIEAGFIADGTDTVSSSPAGRVLWKGASLVYRLNRWLHYKWAELYVRNCLPEIAKVQDRARLDGGLVGDYQFVRLWELRRILDKLRPHTALELGSGASTAVFADYFRDASRFTTVEENPEWRERTLTALGGLMHYVTSRQAPRRIAMLDGEMICHYDMEHNNYYDLVYVDGPTNVAPDGLLSIDGKTPLLANADTGLFLSSGQPIPIIVIDGRRNTVRRLILSDGAYYRIWLKTDYLPRTSPLDALTFRYHTLMLRCVPAEQEKASVRTAHLL